MKIVVIGSTGLIGSWILNQALLDDRISEIHILTRKLLVKPHPKLVVHPLELGQNPKLENSIFDGAHALIIAIGTTRKKTPDLVEYRKIDYGITMQMASIASAHNVSQLHIVSAIGANSNSKIFYNKLKGEIEEALASLKFPQLFIYRPSLLIGKRKELRIAEKIAQFILPLFDCLLWGAFSKYKTVHSKIIANSIIKNLRNKKRGVIILERNNF